MEPRRRSTRARAIARWRSRGPYVLQAAIASLQLESPVDWPQVVALYASWRALTRSPVVELNRAVAIAEAGSPETALAIVDALALDDYRYLHSTRAELLRRLGRLGEARGRVPRAPWHSARRSPSGGSSSGASQRFPREIAGSPQPPCRRWERDAIRPGVHGGDALPSNCCRTASSSSATARSCSPTAPSPA